MIITLSLILILIILLLSLLFISNSIEIILVLGVISVCCVLFYVKTSAIDVAFTEAAIGAGISTTLTLIVVHLTKSYKPNYIRKKSGNKYYKLLKITFITLVFLTLSLILIYCVMYIPPLGDTNNPINNELSEYYIQNSYKTFNIPNIVTMILGSFRGFDTMFETVVIYLASLGVYVILRSPFFIKENTILRLKEEEEEISNNEFAFKAHIIVPDIDLVKKSTKTESIKSDIVLYSTLFLLIPIIFIFGSYVQFYGDYGPGGGFQAGVIFSSIYILITILLGYNSANAFIPIYTLIRMLSFGCILYIGTGMITLFMGGNFLDYYVFGNNNQHSYHYGLFIIELGVCITVFAAMSIMIGQFYNLLKISTNSYKNSIAYSKIHTSDKEHSNNTKKNKKTKYKTKRKT